MPTQVGIHLAKSLPLHEARSALPLLLVDLMAAKPTFIELPLRSLDKVQGGAGQPLPPVQDRPENWRELFQPEFIRLTQRPTPKK